MTWIKCEDMMPEQMTENQGRKKVKVLVAIKNKNGVIIRTQERRISSSGNWMWRCSPGEVTHWMPLPDPPECEVEDYGRTL